MMSPLRRLRALPTTVLLSLLSPASSFSLSPRDTVPILPEPLQWNPDQNWDGIDGNWSTFTLAIGTGPQYVRVFPSTASQQTWAIDSQGCLWTRDGSCPQSRGGLFNTTKSSSWDDVGVFSLHIEENLGYYGNANYGFDNITLGGFGDGLPEIEDAVVGSTAGLDNYLGIFGLAAKPTNFTSFNNGSASALTKLRNATEIPSLSYGYTAGAKYRGLTGVLASLTLGGYDESRFTQNDVSFTFAPDNERDLVVSVEQITVSYNAFNATPAGKLNLVSGPTSFAAFIDSTVAPLWLPPAVLTPLEQTFGLVYDTASQLYLLSEQQHKALLAASPNFTFTLSNQTQGGPTVNITLPYAALDQWALSPFQNLTTSSRYLPFLRGNNPKQYTLGRAFLQEAYLGVDYERQKFNVSAARWDSVQNPEIQTITPLDTNGFPTQSKSASNGLGGGAIAGIVVGAVLGIAAVVGLILWFCMPRRKQYSSDDDEFEGKSAFGSQRPWTSKTGRSNKSGDATLGAPGHASQISLGDGHVIPKAELEADGPLSRAKIAGSEYSSPTGHGTMMSSEHSPDIAHAHSPLAQPPINAAPVEADNQHHEIYEMPGSTPVPQEMATAAQMGETDKERDIARAGAFNGVNPAVERPS